MNCLIKLKKKKIQCKYGSSKRVNIKAMERYFIFILSIIKKKKKKLLLSYGEMAYIIEFFGHFF